jgi:hypothetical protein
MLVDSFEFSLKHPVPQGLVVIAKCIFRKYNRYLVDGKNPALAAATTGGKVYIHQALIKNNDDSEGLPPTPV